LSLHDVLDRVLILNEGDDPHLCFTLSAAMAIASAKTAISS
jgi:hypothetical protein